MGSAVYALDVGGLGAAAAIGFGAVFGFLVVMGLRYRGSNRRILEWDPYERAVWRSEQEDLDLYEMLELHNAERRRLQLDPLTLEEYREHVRLGRPT